MRSQCILSNRFFSCILLTALILLGVKSTCFPSSRPSLVKGNSALAERRKSNTSLHAKFNKKYSSGKDRKQVTKAPQQGGPCNPNVPVVQPQITTVVGGNGAVGPQGPQGPQGPAGDSGVTVLQVLPEQARLV